MTGTLHICVAMKPLVGDFARNALAFGVAGLNIDGGRVGIGDDRTSGGMGSESTTFLAPADKRKYARPTGGRWPANVIHDGSEDVVRAFPVTDGKFGMTQQSGHNRIYGQFGGGADDKKRDGTSDSGSAARFFKQIGEFEG
jgi:site-specific DNA-methyltransferase (adenine-specific)